jgi:hypothetical protein
MISRFHVLLSPLFLASLALLFINDFFLKQAYPGWITGKLSDVAGLFLFPLFVWFILGRGKQAIYLSTALAFTLWKLPLSDAVISLWNGLLPLKIGRVPDLTDLLALAVLPLSYHYSPAADARIESSMVRWPLAAFTLFCIIASETTEVRFMNKAPGFFPLALSGDYV